MQKTIQFQILDWYQYDEETEVTNNEIIHAYEDDEPETKLGYKISLFGRTDNYKTIHVKVEDFTPHFYIEIPSYWAKNKYTQTTKIMQLVSHIKHNVARTASAKIINGLEIYKI